MRDWKLQLVRNLADCLMGAPHFLSMEEAYRLAFAHYSKGGTDGTAGRD